MHEVFFDHPYINFLMKSQASPTIKKPESSLFKDFFKKKLRCARFFHAFLSFFVAILSFSAKISL